MREYLSKNNSLWMLSVMLFFMMLFDGTLGYVIPLLISQSGLTNTVLGFVMGSSSFAGGIFDFILSKFLKNTQFRRLFLGMFLLAGFYGIVLWNANAVFAFIIAMALWGLWYDLMIFGTFNFIGRVLPRSAHASGFANIDSMRSLAFLVAPLISGFLVGEVVGSKPFVVAFIFLTFSLLFYLLLILRTKKDFVEENRLKPQKHSFISEFKHWFKVGRPMSPVLVFLVLMNIFDSFFWTLGPLMSESLGKSNAIGSFFLTSYYLPAFLVSWFTGVITKKFGKKRTAIVSLILGSLVLSSFALFNSSLIILLVVILASSLSAFAWPAMKGAAADYISEAPLVEKEIEGVTDFSGNFGYIIGPILAGIISQSLGSHMAFSILGLMGVIVGIILLVKTPRHIRVPNKL